MERMPVIGDLVEARQRLEVGCSRHGCLHRRLIPPEEAVDMLGADCTFPRAARRLYCPKCGARGREGMVWCRGSMEDFYVNRGHTRRPLSRDG